MKNSFFERAGAMLKDNRMIFFLLAAVLGAAVFSYRTVNDINRKLENQRIEKSRQTPPPADSEPVRDVEQPRDNVPLPGAVSPGAPAADSASEEPEDSEDEKKFTLPVSGKIFSSFSGDELVYNRTLDDWRTHNGIDISAPMGDPVRAGADGVVKRIYTDGLLGTVAEVDHGDFVARYCGLDSSVYVKEGRQVTRGQNIGTVGEVDMELSEQPHLHLEIIAGGKTVNPDTLLG